jgi:methylamine dehydrogenase accessory protein MauD
MRGWWLISYLALWLLVVSLVFVCLACLRQLGLVYLRIGGPLGAHQTSDRPELGDEVPAREVYDVAGLARSLIPGAGRYVIALFMSPTCSICDSIIPHLNSFARAGRRSVDVLVVLNAPDRQGKFSSIDGQPTSLVVDPKLHDLFGIPALPYGVAIDDQGRIASKGTINDVVQVESLLNQAEGWQPDGELGAQLTITGRREDGHHADATLVDGDRQQV